MRCRAGLDMHDGSHRIAHLPTTRPEGLLHDGHSRRIDSDYLPPTSGSAVPVGGANRQVVDQAGREKGAGGTFGVSMKAWNSKFLAGQIGKAHHKPVPTSSM